MRPRERGCVSQAICSAYSHVRFQRLRMRDAGTGSTCPPPHRRGPWCPQGRTASHATTSAAHLTATRARQRATRASNGSGSGRAKKCASRAAAYASSASSCAVAMFSTNASAYATAAMWLAARMCSVRAAAATGSIAAASGSTEGPKMRQSQADLQHVHAHCTHAKGPERADHGGKRRCKRCSG